jgi:hypothetical protein
MSEYVTTDLQLSSYLKAIGHEPVRVEGPRDRRRFVFVNVPAKHIADYHEGSRPVAPQSLFAAYRALKRRVFETV